MRTADRASYQSAWIAFEVYALRVAVHNLLREPRDQLKLEKDVEDFLVTFQKRGAKRKPPPVDEAPLDADGNAVGYTPALSKDIWLGAFGIDPNDPATWGGR